MGETARLEEPRLLGFGSSGVWGVREEISGFAHASVPRVRARASGECVRATWNVDVAAESVGGVLEGPTEADAGGGSEACGACESDGGGGGGGMGRVLGRLRLHARLSVWGPYTI